MITYKEFIDIVTKCGFKIKNKYYIDMTNQKDAQSGYLIAKYESKYDCVRHWMKTDENEFSPTYSFIYDELSTRGHYRLEILEPELFEKCLMSFCDNWKNERKKLRFNKIEEL